MGKNTAHLSLRTATLVGIALLLGACGTTNQTNPPPEPTAVTIHITYDTQTEALLCDTDPLPTSAATWQERIPSDTPEGTANDVACRQAIKTTKDDEAFTAALDALTQGHETLKKAQNSNNPPSDDKIKSVQETLKALEVALRTDWDHLHEVTATAVAGIRELQNVSPDGKGSEESAPREMGEDTPNTADERDTTPRSAPKSPSSKDDAPKSKTSDTNAKQNQPDKLKKPSRSPQTKPAHPKKTAPKKDSTNEKSVPKEKAPPQSKPATQRAPTTDIDGPLSRKQTNSLLPGVNKYRSDSGAKPLKKSNCAEQQALTHAKRMAKTGSFNHQDLDKVRAACPEAGWIGENIAKGYTSGDAALTGWFNSPSHKENMLSTNFTHVGMAVAYATDGTAYWVQVFI